jgi:histidine triad (HIT) family protein
MMDQNDFIKEPTMTLFAKIIAGEIPADKVFEDEHCIAIRDINPQAPTHILVIPKKPLVNMADASEGDAELLGHLMLTAKAVAEQEGIAETGYRLVLNVGRHGGQSVDHLHVHLLGGRSLSWPPG